MGEVLKIKGDCERRTAKLKAALASMRVDINAELASGDRQPMRGSFHREQDRLLGQ
jgi:hypothetical protein